MKLRRSDPEHFPSATRRLVLLLLVGWLCGSPEKAQAVSLGIAVTPTKLEQGGLVFALTSRAVDTGTAIHITVGFKEGAAPKGARAGLTKIIRTEMRGGFMISRNGVPGVDLKVTKGDKGWTIDFIATKELLSQPDVYFVFTVPTYDSDGHPMPAMDFYDMRLVDFVK